jgi:hypothetical protein
VWCMKQLMEHCAEFEIAPIRKSVAHKHVNNIRKTGIVILLVMVVKDSKVFVGFYIDQEKIYLGYLKVKTDFDISKTKDKLTMCIQDTQNAQPHDEATSQRPVSNYLSAPRFYCVETLCAPCGVVIAWTKFSKAESPTNILQFLQKVYPTEESRPAYICIDKACLVLRTSIANKSWDMWKKTTRFVVDSYHYVNHRTTDYLCRKWCNPAPLNGSAPNLVVVEYDNHGRPHYKRAFNTQVCPCVC